MFDSVRKYQRVMLGLVLLLILPAFVFFGVSGYDRMADGRDEVAVVAGQSISRQAFDQAHRQQVERMQQMLGGQIDARLFDSPEARAQTLEALITQQALLAEARDKRIAATPADVRKAVLAIEGLKGADGQFDFDRYRTLLAQQNLTPEIFEAQIAQDLTAQALANAVQNSAIMPKVVVDRLFLAQESQRLIRVRTIDPTALETGLEPTDEQLRKYYDEHPEAFQLPESVSIEFLVLDRAKLGADGKPTEDELRAYYEQNKGQFNEPEQRRASHILIGVPADADAARKAAAKESAAKLLAEVRERPDGFAELATANSTDPGSAAQGGDLGFFERDMMVKPFSDAAFATKEGEIADLVESEYGFHVIRVTGAKGSGAQPFAEVRDRIEDVWRQQQGAKRYAELAEAFTNTVYEQPESLQPAAARFGLEIQQASNVGRAPAPAVAPGSALANARLLGLLFGEESLKNRRNSEAIEIAPGKLASARVTDYQSARREPFDAVRDAARARWVAAEAARLAREQGEKLLAQLQASAQADKGDKAAKEGDLTDFAPARSVTRASPGDLSPQALAAVFKRSTDSLPAYVGVDLGPRGYQLIQLQKAEGPDPTAAGRRPLYAQQARRIESQAVTGAWVEGVKDRIAIERKLR